MLKCLMNFKNEKENAFRIPRNQRIQDAASGLASRSILAPFCQNLPVNG